MPYLKLIVTPGDRTFELRDALVRLGRDPLSTIPFTGDDARVVSARHAELRWQDGQWHVVDLGSRNGTCLNGRRLSGNAPLKPGDAVTLGETGPKVAIAAVAEGLAETLLEHPKMADAKPPAPGRPPEQRVYGITMLAAATGKRFEARGTRIRMGRGSECEIRPVDPSDTTVSRVHAELTVGPSGSLVVRDAGSRNGTFVNGERVGEAVPVRIGDKLMLGPGGPVLIVEGLGTGPVVAVPRGVKAGLGQQTVIGLIGNALAKAKEERRQGRRGTTAFFKAVADEVGRDSRRKIRWLTTTVVVLVLLLGAGVYGVYRLLSAEVAENRQTTRSVEDSARAETDRLRQELLAARAAAAPAAQVDSLRAQLEASQARTAQLQAALERAQTALTQQLAAGETRRQQAQSDLQRLRDELAAAERRAPSQSLIDSLRRQISATEAQASSLDARMRAIRGTDFASIAQQNQAAVGLLTVSFGRDYYNGTGFVISADGYMLTNWHVVADTNAPRADTIWVTMADQATSHFADVVALSQDRDIALVRIRGYQGPYVTAIDWGATKARQGEPAALIGYPAGAGFARYRSSVVRTSMTAGIISRVTEDVIQFDGMTIGGSSGSPVFNANGEVISIHRAGLPQAPGFALSVPLKHAVPLLPQALRQKLGIE